MTSDGMQALCARLVHYVLPEVGKLDARSLTILNRKGILKKRREIRNEFDLGHLNAGASRDPWYPDGPLVVQVKWEEGKATGEVAGLGDLVFDWDVEVRRQIVSYFRRQKGLLAKPTQRTIEQQGTVLAGEQQGDWELAALNISRAIKNDFTLNVAGLRQSIALRHDQSYRAYLAWLLTPPLEGVEVIELAAWTPTEGVEGFARIIEECASCSSLDGVLDAYYERLGHLPLGEFSAGAAVEAWAASHAMPKECWKLIEKWAQKRRSPIAVYHATEIALRCWDQVEPDAGAVAGFVTQIMRSHEKEFVTEREGNGPWRLHCGLAAHYLRHLELLVPGHRQERIAASALWMARQVAESFGVGNDKGVERLWAGVRQTIEQTRFIWLFGAQAPATSALRYGVVFSPSIWSDGMAEILGSSPDGVLNLVLRPEVAEQLVRPLVQKQAMAFPMHAPHAETHFSFGRGVASAAQAVDDRLGDNKRPELKGGLELYERMSDPEEVYKALKDIWTSPGISQMFIANSLRVLVLLGAARQDRFWALVESDEWRKHVFEECALEAIEILVGALLQLAIVNRSDSTTVLAHCLADAVINADTDRERRSQLFILTVMSCLATDSVSPLQRLLLSRQKDQLAEDVATLRENLIGLHRIAPPWLTGRLRAILAVL